uniref:FAD dependent oxidoreductase domain-containing protein n=1 Tax=Pinguiococcus pyrenoidosus TaxID=172671 RepID=A0A7R9U7Q2_9STRA
MGAATAYALRQTLPKSKVVMLVEQFDDPVHGQGSSHGDGRAFRFAYGDLNYAKLAKVALRGWKDIEKRSAEKLLYGEDKGGVDIADAAHPHLRDLESVLSKLNSKTKLYVGEELSKDFPQIRLSESEAGLHSKDSCVIHADKALQCLHKLSIDNGVFVEYGKRCNEIKVDMSASRRNIEAFFLDKRHKRRRSVQTDSLILCGGPWTEKLVRGLTIGNGYGAQRVMQLPEMKASLETIVYYGFKNDAGEGVPDHGVGHLPMFMVHEDNGIGPHGYYGLPVMNIPGVKVSAHYCGPIIDPDEREHIGYNVNTDDEGGKKLKNSELIAAQNARVQAVIDSCDRLVERLFPFLDVNKKMAVKHCVYTATPDHDFLLGPLRVAKSEDISAVGHTIPGLFIAGGFSGHGFKFAPAIGEIMAAYVRNYLQEAATRDSAAMGHLGIGMRFKGCTQFSDEPENAEWETIDLVPFLPERFAQKYMSPKVSLDGASAGLDGTVFGAQGIPATK